MTKYWRKKITAEKKLNYFLIKTTIYLFLGLHKELPIYRRSFQLSKENPWVIFALLDSDPDPLTRFNPDTIGIRIRNPGESAFITCESAFISCGTTFMTCGPNFVWHRIPHLRIRIRILYVRNDPDLCLWIRISFRWIHTVFFIRRILVHFIRIRFHFVWIQVILWVCVSFTEDCIYYCCVYMLSSPAFSKRISLCLSLLTKFSSFPK